MRPPPRAGSAIARDAALSRACRDAADGGWRRGRTPRAVVRVVGARGSPVERARGRLLRRVARRAYFASRRARGRRAIAATIERSSRIRARKLCAIARAMVTPVTGQTARAVDESEENEVVDAARGDARERAAAFRRDVEMRCDAVRRDAEAASAEQEELRAKLATTTTENASVRESETDTKILKTPPATPSDCVHLSLNACDFNVSADAEELVKALLKSQRERESFVEVAQETGAARSKGSSNRSGHSTPDDINYGFHKAQLRDELEKIRRQVLEETLTLEGLRRETAELRTTRAATSSDEAVVKDKLTKTRTQLTLLENEQAQLTEDLEYQHKSSAAVRKACQDEEHRLRKQIDELRKEAADEEERAMQLKSDTCIAVEILEEHEQYIEKVKGKLEGLEAEVESKTKLLRELDCDQGSIEEELEALRTKLKEESELGDRLRAKEAEDRANAQRALEAIKTEAEKLKEDKRSYEADIERSQEALAEAVHLLQVAKDTAEQEMSWTANPLRTPPPYRQVGHSYVYDSAQNSPLEAPMQGVRLFDDSPMMKVSAEDKAYHHLMIMEKAAKDAEARRMAAESGAHTAEVRLRRMVEFVNRLGPSATSSPSRPRSPQSGDYAIYRRDSPTNSVIDSLDSLRLQLASAVKQKSRAGLDKVSRRRESAPREELHFKLNQLIDEIGKTRKHY